MKIAHKHIVNHASFVKYVTGLQDYEIQMLLDYCIDKLPENSLIIAFLVEELNFRTEPETIH